MKIYSIGRETGCNIVINDSTDVISRRHAILSVDSMGKMTITDQSHNGTYVNGIRLSSNVAVPVTRKDNISFAQIARLDWKLIPDPTKIYKYIAAGIIGVIALAALTVGGIFIFRDNGGGDDPEPPVIEKPEKEEISQEELVRREKARQDSIENAIRDSIRKANQGKPATAPQKPTKPTKEKVEQPKEENQTRIR